MLRTKFRTKKHFLVQFFPIFMSICLTLGAFGLKPATQKVYADSDVTMTFTVKGWADSTASGRIDDETSGVSDTGIAAVMNNYYPKTGQVLGRATNSNDNFYILNTDEIPGSITSITITGKIDDSNYFQNNMYAAVDCESQSAVTESRYGIAGTGSKEGFSWSFTGDEGYTYFKLYSDEKFAKGTIGEAVITVTYTPKTTDRKLDSIYIDGTASKLQYIVGEEFDPTGLKVMGRYDDILGDTEITSGITWSFEPETLSANTTQVSVTAQFKDFTSEAKIVNDLTVTVPVHVYDILPPGFPSGAPSVMKNGWTNGNSKIVLFQDALYLDNDELLLKTKFLTESDGNYVYIDSVNSKKITFCMKDGVLEKINLSGFTSTQNGDYVPQPTIADILEKAESDFPTATSLDVSPDGAWVNSTNTSATLFIYGSYFIFKDWSNPSAQAGTTITSVVTKNGDNYQSTFTNATITFNMSGGKLVSISFEHLKDAYASLDGTYTAPVAVAEIDCPTCHGDGLAQCSECFGLGCAACDGGNVPCTNCGETGKISFTTLKDAISAVTYYGKIILLKDNSEEIEISEEAVFIIDKASLTFDKSKITAGTGYDISTTENGTETTFIVTHQKTIASILPEDFPTFSMPLSDKVWVNANCATSKLYKNLFNGLTFGGIEQYVDFQNILTAPVTKVENGYKFTKDSYTITFVMDDFDKLVQINLEGSEYADINGDYLPPHIHTLKETYPKVDAKCLEEGHEAYYECSCGKFFSDKALAEEILDLDVWLAIEGGGYIRPLGHEFGGEVTYTWNDRTHECTASWKCQREGCTEIQTETVTGVYVKDTDATCLENEKGHYEATFTIDGFVKQSTAANSVVKPDTATGHHFSGDVTYTWEGDQCTASWKCDHAGCNEVQTKTVTGVYVKDSDATTESNEKGHYEAVFSLKEFGTNSTAPNSVEKPNTKLPSRLSGGAIAGIVIGSVFGLLIIAFVVLYILWKRKNLNVPILSKVLTPAFRFINKLFFKTELNDVEAKEAETKPMKE